MRHHADNRVRGAGGIPRPAVNERAAASFAHAGMPAQNRLDFTEFNPLAAYLNLIVAAPEKFQATVGTPANAVARAIHTRVGRVGERVG